MPSSICSKLETSRSRCFWPAARELVAAHPAPVRRHAPARAHAARLEKALQRRIERAFFDAQELVRGALNVLDEPVAVQRLLLQGLENHHLERARKEVLAIACLRAHRRLHGSMASMAILL